MIRLNGSHAWFLAAALAAVPASGQDPVRTVRLGVLADRGGEKARRAWQPTADYLAREIPGQTFEVVPLAPEAIAQAVIRREVEFVATSPVSYVTLEVRLEVSRIVSLLDWQQGVACKHRGAVIFTRVDRRGIQSLRDLRGMTFRAFDQGSFGGWWMAWRELLDQGIDPYRDFHKLRFGGTYASVVADVLEGKADAGTVPTADLERMAAEGRLDLAEVRVLNPQHPTPEFPFARSTRLYPHWVLATLPDTPDDLARAVTVALLKLPGDSPVARVVPGAGWTTPLSFQSVHDLLRTLRRDPYQDVVPATPPAVSGRDRSWPIAAGVALALLLGTTAYALSLRRTRARLRTSLAGEEGRNSSIQETALAERRALEEQLREAQGRLVQSSKLAALGQMIVEVVHDINHLLAFVTNDLSVLQRDVGELRELVALYRQSDALLAREHPELLGRIRDLCERVDMEYTLGNFDVLMHRIREGLRRMKQVVKDLRAFVRHDDGAREAVDLNASIESTINIILGYAKKHQVRLEADLQPLPPVTCSASKIDQVMMNLLLNAIDACGGGGTVTARTRAEPDGVRIEVEDTGCGIPAALRERIFEAFFTTKPDGVGTGLGLSISSGIVREHGGTIEVESTPGVGTRFAIHMPLRPPPREAERRVPQGATEAVRTAEA